MFSPKRIVIATQGSLGDLYPYIALATGLQARGHDVVIARNSQHHERVIEAGIEWHRMGPELPDDPALYAKAMDPKTGLEFVFKDVFAPAVKESYDDLLKASEHADLLISTPLAFAAPLLAEKQNLLWASGLLQPMAFFSAYDPPILSEARRLTTALRPFGRLCGGAMRALWRASTRSWGQPMQELRRELGLPFPGPDPLWEGQDSPYLLLAMFPYVLATAQPDWPAQTKVTGTLFWDGSQAEQTIAPELAHFLDNGSPPIVFTLGSTAVHEAGNFYAESLAAVQALGSRAILLYGSDPRNRAQLPEKLPPEVLALPYAPHFPLFQASSAVVHHGGVGTLSQAMRAGKPMLIVPFTYDQPDNAARAYRLGIARTLRPSSYHAAAVAAELRLLLGSMQIRNNAEAIGRQVRAENGITTACDLLEALLEKNASPHQRVANLRAGC